MSYRNKIITIIYVSKWDEGFDKLPLITQSFFPDRLKHGYF